MFQIGDCVVSSTNGICNIEDQVWLDLSGEKRMYFLLIPMKDTSSKLYIPVDSAEKRIRKAMTEDEATKLLASLKVIPELEIKNEKFCEKEYKAAVYSGDPVMLAKVIKTIYLRREKRLSSGKKTTVIDDRYFKTAIHVLHSELAYALGSEEDAVEGKIIEAIG